MNEIGRKFNKVQASVLLIALVFELLLPFSLTPQAQAASAFTKQINYQGKLTDSSGVVVANGNYHMMFRLYTAVSGGSAIWTEDRSADLGNRATVRNGLFSVLLGSSTALTSVDFNQTLYLGVEVGGSGASPSWDGEMSPRKRLGVVPAAFE